MYHVKKNSSGKWIIINDGAKRASKVFNSKNEAINYANNNYKGNYRLEEDSPKVNITLGKGKNKKTFKLPLGLAIVLGIIVILFGIYYFGSFDALLKNAGLDNYTAETVFNKKDNKNTNENHSHATEGVIYDDFQIHFLELGNDKAGDSVYIKAGNTDILIDAGSRAESAPTIIDYVNDYCTDGKLEYVIATHAHQDHIAGFAGEAKTSKNYKGETVSRNGVLYYFDVENIIDFAYQGEVKKTDIASGVLATDNKTASSSNYDISNSVYGKYLLSREYAVSKGANHKTAKELWDNNSKIFTLSEGITMNILYNYFYFNPSNDENNYSVCTMLNYNDHHFMLTGDLEKEGEAYLASYYDASTLEKTLPHCDLFKAGHHGSPTSSNDCLLSKISPDICCVCCCAGSTEYTKASDNIFPSQDFINRISKYTDQVYVTSVFNEKTNEFTSMNGDILVSAGFKDGVFGIGVSAKDLTILKETAWFNEEIYTLNGNVCDKDKKYYNSSTEGATKTPRRIWPS